VKVKHGPSRKGNIPHSLASIEKSQKLLHYKPSHFIENGLKESIKYYYTEKK
jgi:UDP-N-acetylglucosamine 4-epimerase